MSNLLFKYSIFHENKQFLSSFEMCCFICFHLKVDFSVQWCTAREQVCCVFMLFHWWSRALSGKHQSKNLQEVTGRTSSPAWNLWNLKNVHINQVINKHTFNNIKLPKLTSGKWSGQMFSFLQFPSIRCPLNESETREREL